MQHFCHPLDRHLAEKGLADIQLERLPGGYPGAVTALDDRFVGMASEAGVPVFGSSLVILPRGPFTQPLALFNQAYGAPTAIIGLARPDSATFAANEHIPISDLINHGQHLIELMLACGRG